MSDKDLHIDIETFSRTDLLKHGIYAYANDPDFEVQMINYAYGTDPVQTWTLFDPFPHTLVKDLLDPTIRKHAFNDTFEVICLTKFLQKNGIQPPKDWYLQWSDTADLTRAIGQAGSLEKAALFFLPHRRKLPKTDLFFFSKPRKPTKTNPSTKNNPADFPDRFQSYIEYGRTDVEIERELYQLLSPLFNPSKKEKKIILQNKYINYKGIPVDLPLAKQLYALGLSWAYYNHTKLKKLTNLENVNSRDQLLKYLISIGYPHDNLQRKTLLDELEQTKNKDIRTIIELRLNSSNTSWHKFKSIINNISQDGRIRNTLVYHGAHTGRWASRSLQIQNMAKDDITKDSDLTEHEVIDLILSSDFSVDNPKNFKKIKKIFKKINPTAVLRGSTRLCLKSDKKAFAIADFSSIETVVSYWLSGELDHMEAFRQRLDPYKRFASDAFQVPYNTVTKEQRNHSKPAVLGCVFGLGQHGLKRQAESFGIEISNPEHLVRVFRQTHQGVVRTWSLLENMFRKALNDKTKVIIDLPFDNATMSCSYIDHDSLDLIKLTLPSGRSLFYPYSELRFDNDFDKYEIIYHKPEQTKKAEIKLYGGKLFENVVQAIARDILATALLRAEKKGLDICFHVHDEIVVNSDKPKKDLDKLLKIMHKPPKWCKSMPIRAEGFITERFRKD